MPCVWAAGGMADGTAGMPAPGAVLEAGTPGVSPAYLRVAESRPILRFPFVPVCMVGRESEGCCTDQPSWFISCVQFDGGCAGGATPPIGGGLKDGAAGMIEGRDVAACFARFLRRHSMTIGIAASRTTIAPASNVGMILSPLCPLPRI